MSTNERILFIDDDDMVRRAFARTLQRLGFERPDTAENATEAIALAEEHEYAVIVTDYFMPDVNGLALADELHHLQPNATYMMVSGQCDLDVALSAINEHAIHNVLTKPWNAEDLRIKLRRGVETYWQRLAQENMQRNAVASSRLIEQQKARLEEAMATNENMMAEVLLNALDLRTRETRAHCRRVAAYCQLLAEAMGIQGHALVSLRHGALLHDVGKIGVPDAILSKPDKLTAEEWETMRQHAEMGAKILDGFAGLQGAREVVLQHHESWDGKGYPQRLAGERILLEARILAVADTLDAMMSDRPYRKGLPLAAAEMEIQRCAGHQFDPEVTAAFAKVDTARWLEVRKQFPDELDVVALNRPLAA